MKKHFLMLAAVLVPCALLFAQDRQDKAPVTFEEIYDEPYSVNKLFIGFQPLYGELFVANVNAGFGLEARYYLRDKMDFQGNFRKTYSQKFFDFSRDLALNNNDADNTPEVFSYYEIGATYHVKDFEQSSKTTMYLYKNSYRGDRWASRVPLFADVPCKVRKIYGARLGGIMWHSSTDLSRALEKQDITNDQLKSSTDAGLPVEEFDKNGEMENVDLFTNITSQGVYVGGSMSWIRNVAVDFDKFEEGIDDLMLTVYADFLYAPSITLDDIVYTQKDATGNKITGQTDTYALTPVKTQPFGFRLGIDGRFNRTLSWSYGGEVGYRPGIAGRMFYAVLKISFPVYGTNLDYKVESFGK